MNNFFGIIKDRIDKLSILLVFYLHFTVYNDTIILKRYSSHLFFQVDNRMCCGRNELDASNYDESA